MRLLRLNLTEFLCLLLILGTLVRVTMSLDSPYDTDENYIASSFSFVTLPQLLDFNPRSEKLSGSHVNQYVSNLASFLAFQLVGRNRTLLRLAPLACTLILLGLLYSLSSSWPPLMRFFVFASLFSNQLALWFFHSLKGYVYAMTATAILSALLLKVENTAKKLSTQEIVLYSTAFILGGFSHSFGALFNVFLCTTLFLLSSRLNHAQKVLRNLSLGLLPLSLWGLLIHFVHLRRIKDLFSQVDFRWVGGSTFLLGIPGWEWGWAFATFIVTLLFLTRNSKLDFMSCLLSVSALALTLMITLFDVRYFYPRYLLPFLIPLLIWIGARLSQIPSPLKTRVMTVTALFLFVLVPILNGPKILRWRTFKTIGYHHFIEHAQNKLKSVPSPCLSFTGAPHEVKWAQRFDFYSSVSSQKCKQDTHRVHFGRGLRKESFPLTLPQPFSTLFADKEGRTVLKLSANTPPR